MKKSENGFICVFWDKSMKLNMNVSNFVFLIINIFID